MIWRNASARESRAQSATVRDSSDDENESRRTDVPKGFCVFVFAPLGWGLGGLRVRCEGQEIQATSDLSRFQGHKRSKACFFPLAVQLLPWSISQTAPPCPRLAVCG